jgi:hypothetical protein
VAGPSFVFVSGWAEQGVPLKIAFAGIDRYFERYYRKGPRRRPVKIDFCDADVLDVFDEWRRATGIHQSSVDSRQSSVDSRQSSVDGPAASPQRPVASHQSFPRISSASLRLTSARAGGSLGDVRRVIDRAAAESTRPGPRRAVWVRGGVRSSSEHLGARRGAGAEARATSSRWRSRLLSREASRAVGFRHAMTEDAFARARQAVIDRPVRERSDCPSSPSKCEPMGPGVSSR